MGDRNSRIEVLLGVTRNLLDDIATLIESSALRDEIPLNPRKESDRDFEYIKSRALSEGQPFLTKTLPLLGKWYDSWLADNRGDIPEGFKPYSLGPGDVTCPLLCRMLAYVISSARVPSQQDANIIRAYRSLFYLYYKLEEVPTQAMLDAALETWKDTEAEIENFDFPPYYDAELIEAREILESLLVRGEGLFREGKPSHGPGAVAGGETQEGKWHNANRIESLHRVYPRYDLYFGFRSDGRISPTMCGEIIAFNKRSKTTEAISRLLFVPKDSRGLRTISCEPKELMFVQQAVCRALMRDFHNLSQGRINFLDQSINGRLARASSASGEFATVDLKDASDRVSLRLVELLFPDWALKFLRALRSTRTLLPDGSLFNHRKFAPMGSAICFPIESVVFWSLAVVSCVRAGMTLADAKARVYVYGDDIILPPDAFPFMVTLFERLALKVNTSKSFTRGPFRESCGVDAYYGRDVTPLKIKKDICHRSLSGPLAMSICEYATNCFSVDFRATGEYLLQLVEAQFPGVIRCYAPIGCLHVIDPLAHEFDKPRVKWNRSACLLSLKGWILQSPQRPAIDNGLDRLLRYAYGTWEEHDPSKVAVLRAAKIRKRNILVEAGALPI